jgi:hypothetical protein
MLSIVWGIFNIHGILGGSLISVFWWLVFIILAELLLLLYFDISDDCWDPTQELLNAILVH